MSHILLQKEFSRFILQYQTGSRFKNSAYAYDRLSTTEQFKRLAERRLLTEIVAAPTGSQHPSPSFWHARQTTLSKPLC